MRLTERYLNEQVRSNILLKRLKEYIVKHRIKVDPQVLYALQKRCINKLRYYVMFDSEQKTRITKNVMTQLVDEYIVEIHDRHIIKSILDASLELETQKTLICCCFL